MPVHHLVATIVVFAQPTGYDAGPGRFGANVAIVVALAGAVIGALALARSAGRDVGIAGRVPGALAPIAGVGGIVLGAVHVARTPMGIGTGNGRAGAVIAIVLGAVAIVTGGLALARARRDDGGVTPE